MDFLQIGGDLFMNNQKIKISGKSIYFLLLLAYVQNLNIRNELLHLKHLKTFYT